MRRAALPLLVLLGLLPAALGAVGTREGPPLDSLARITIQSHGRLMPLDTFARLTLYELSGRVRVGRESALSWLARLVFEPAGTLEDKVFLVDHPDTLTALGLGGSRGRYSLRDLEPGLERLAELARAAEAVAVGVSDRVAADLNRLSRAVTIYRDLVASLDYARARNGETGESLPDLLASGDAGPWLLRWTARGWRSPLKVVPPPVGERAWLSPETALLSGGSGEELSRRLAAVVTAWDLRDWAAARDALERFRRETGATPAAMGPVAMGPAATGLEILYNRSRLFLLSSLAALAALAAHLGFRGRLRATPLAAVLMGSAWAFHTVGLLLRMLVSGRPPVTNLYTSFLFVAWAALALGLYLRAGRGEDAGVWIGALGAPLLVLLSTRFAAEGDPLGVLQAVLDTNFWLSTHVVSITLGYGGCVAAGVAGHLYLVRRIHRPWEEAGHARLYRLIYGTLVLALVLSFLGTVLGGIWADQSWGRFWGWDPKENGALLIILWIAILLHARLARLVEHRGVAAGAVLLIPVLLFSWIGVNLMGVGLHAYGWTSGMGLVALGAGAAEVLFVLLTFPLAGRAPRGPTDLVKARVVWVTPETPDTVSVGLRPAQPLVVTPGRYITLFGTVDGLTRRRPYSFSTLSRPDGSFGITVRRVEGGAVSEWITRKLRPGDRVRLAGPAGVFGLNGEASGAAPTGPGPVFVAAGSGIAPLAPMAEQYLRGGGEGLVLVYGSRDRDHIIFRRRLEALEKMYPGFRVHHVLAEPDAGWTGERGRVTGELVLRLAGTRTDRGFYLCGADTLVDEVRAALLEAGVAPARIQAERFQPGLAEGDPGPGRGGRVRFGRSGRSLAVRPGETILEAGLRAAVPIPHSCVAGRCRECAARVISGTVHMDEPNALSAAERAQGVILACCARPAGDAEVDL